MANNTQDVELRIRATNLSKQTTDKVVSSLEELTKAQDKQIESAKKGAATAAELEKGYKDIEDAAKALISQGGLIKLFEAQSQAAADSQARMEAARAALTAYANSMDPAVSKTRAQEIELKALSKALAGAEKAYASIQTRVTTTGERLAQFGIDTNNLAAAQSKINGAVNSANDALERQDRALGGLTLRQQRLKAVEDARASREQAIAVENAFAAAQAKAAASLEAEAQAQRDMNAASDASNRERQVAVDVAFANAQRDAAEALNKKTAALIAQNAAMRAAADAAERQMRATGASTRATAPVSTSNVAGTIRDIGDPAAAAIQNVQGLEAAVASLESQVASLNGPVKNYKQAIQDASAAQAGFQRIAGNIDTYNRQIAALKASRAEYVASRTAVNALIVEMRSGAAGDDITTRLARAQSTLAAAANQFGNLATAARATRDSLSQAGVNTNNLADAEAQLVNQATRAAGAVNQLTAAYNQHGAAVERSSAGMLGWLMNGRNTVSYAQRIKGELITLAAGYIGLNASIELAKDSLDTYSKFQALNARLLVASGGDAKAAAAEFQYLTAVSDKFGFVLLDIGNAYAKFGIAAKAAGFNTQETRYVFEQFSKAARNARLSTAEFEGILKAVEQMMSKGTVQAEELRGQLGDRLPGAFAIAAKAAGQTTAEYAKMLELGQISSDEVINIARGVGETYGAIAAGGDTLNQAQAKFQNAADRFKDAIAEKGFADAYMEFLSKLTEIISGDNGGKLAASLAAGFTAVLDVVLILVDNLDSVIEVIKLLIGLKLIGWAMDAAKGIGLLRLAFVAMNREIYALVGTGVVEIIVAIGGGATAAAGGVGILTASVAALRVAIGLLVRAIPYVGAALLVIEGLKFAWDKYFDVDDAKAAGAKAGKAGAEAAGAAAADTPAPTPRDKSYSVYQKTLDDRSKAEAKLEEQRLDILKQGNKKNLGERLKFVDAAYNADRTAAKAQITDKTALELRLNDIQQLSLKDQANERLRYQNEQATSEETAGKKREKLALEISTKLKEIEADLAKRAAAQDSTTPFEDRRAARVEAIGHAYDDLSKKIVEQAKLDAPAAAAARAKLNILVEQRKQEESINATRDEALRLEKEFNNLQEIQKAQLAAIETQRSTGQINAQQALEQSNAVIAQTGPAIEAAGQKALTFANRVRLMLDPVVYQKMIATIGQGMAKADVDASTSLNNLNATQTQLNTLLEQQKLAIDQITLKRKLGITTSEQEAEALNKNTADYKAQLQDLTTTMLQQLEIAKEFGAITPEAYAKAKAGIDALVLSTNNATAASTQLQETITGSLVNNALTGFEALGKEIANVVTGVDSIGQGFRAAGMIAAQFFAGLLRDIAMAIAKQLILNAISSYFGAGSGIGSAAIKMGGVVAGGQHTGGVTGQNASFKRNVDARLFSGAPKYHTGGLAGLAPNEVPAILQKNEEVLTRDDPRHILNGGTAGGGGAGTRVVVVDERSKVAEAMQTSEGERVIMHYIKRNSATIKQWVGK